MNSQTAWKLLFLGTPEIHQPQTRITWFRTQKVLLLLDYLSQQRQETLREQLASLFWPQSSRARNVLNQELLWIRRNLPGLLHETPHHVHLVPGTFTADFAEFERLARSLDNMDTSADRRPVLKQALKLYRGDFLATNKDEFLAEGWLLSRRTYFREIAHALRIALAEQEEAHGNLRAAHEAVCIAALLRPEDESTRDLVMRLGEQTRQEQISERITGHLNWESVVIRMDARERQGEHLTLREETVLEGLLLEKFDALPEGQQKAIARLLVFPASFTPAQAEAICGVKENLLLKLQRERFLTSPSDRLTFSETIRTHLKQHRVPKIPLAVQKKYARYFQEWSRQEHPFEQWQTEGEHLRATLRWFMQQEQIAEVVPMGMQLRLYEIELPHQEIFGWLAERVNDSSLSTSLNKSPLPWISHLALAHGGMKTAYTLILQGIERNRAVLPAGELAELLHHVALLAHHNGDAELALSAIEQALQYHEASSYLRLQSEIYRKSGNYPEALQSCERALELNMKTGSRPLAVAAGLYQMGLALLRLDEEAEAEVRFEEALQLRQEHQDEHGIADCLQELASLRAHKGKYGEARTMMDYALLLYERRKAEASRAAALGRLADILHLQGNRERARELYAEGLAFWRSQGNPDWVESFEERLGSLLSCGST